MKAWLFVGAKVVCMDSADTDGLVSGAEYTVRKVQSDWGIFRGTLHENELTVLLDETSHVAFSGEDYGWHVSRFRPVSTIDTTRAVEALRKLTMNPRIDA